MRYRVEFRYREDTGEVELLQVDALESGQRATDHDERHDQFTAQLASVFEQYAVVEEVSDPAARIQASWTGIGPEEQEAARDTRQAEELGSD
jgi:hypothetical protein